MDIHFLQYQDTPIDIYITDLNSNSYIFYPEAGVSKKIEVKGIEVNKLAQMANTNFGVLKTDQNGKTISSSSGSLKNQLPFSYFANSTTDLTFMEAIDKKMINGIMKHNFGVYVFDQGGIFIEPIDFDLTGGDNTLDINILCGYSYKDLQYSLKKNEGDWGDWTGFAGPFFRLAPLQPGEYSVKVKSAGVNVPEIFTRTATVV